MQNNTKLDAIPVRFTLTKVERLTLCENFTGLSPSLTKILNLQNVQRDRVTISIGDLESLIERLEAPIGRRLKKETREILQQIRERIADELNLLNSRSSSVAVDNAAHALYKSSLKNKTSSTLVAANDLLAKMRALPLRMREFKLSPKEKRFLNQCDFPPAVMAKFDSKVPSLNLADVIVILAKRYELDKDHDAVRFQGFMELRGRVLDYLDQQSKRTIQINRQRALQVQQKWHRKNQPQDA